MKQSGEGGCPCEKQITPFCTLFGSLKIENIWLNPSQFWLVQDQTETNVRCAKTVSRWDVLSPAAASVERRQLEGEGGAEPWADLNNTTDPTSNTINFVATSTLPASRRDNFEQGSCFLDGHQELYIGWCHNWKYNQWHCSTITNKIAKMMLIGTMRMPRPILRWQV